MRVARAHRRQPLDHAGRIGPAVGVVADVDDAVVRHRPPREVGGDRRMDRGELVVAAVHVADGVEPHAVRCACFAD